jgi:hypothetical protein
MNAARLLLFFVGVILVIVAATMLFFQSGLSKWVPAGIAGAALLLFIGVAVMGASEKVPAEHGHHETSGHHDSGGPMVVEKRVEEHH